MSGREKVILYTAPHCGTSDRARSELLAEGVDLEERDVMMNKQWFDEALSYSIFVPIVIREHGKVEIGWKVASAERSLRRRAVGSPETGRSGP